MLLFVSHPMPGGAAHMTESVNGVDAGTFRRSTPWACVCVAMWFDGVRPVRSLRTGWAHFVVGTR